MSFKTFILLYFYVVCTEVRATAGKGILDALFSPCKCRCGISNREQRLLGGEYISTYEFPWISVIHAGDSRHFLGTLINNKYIITAASQLIGLTPYDIKVTLGQFDSCVPDVSSTNISVEKIVIHTDFNQANLAHDLALLKLSNPVPIERRMSPICLAIPGNTYIGQVATVTGWKELNHTEDSNTSCKLKKLGLPVLDYKSCAKYLPEAKHFNTIKGCMGIINVPSVVCKLDAGGPVMYRSYKGDYELIGVLSDNNHCNSDPDLAAFTRVNTEHLSWITDNTNDACYCIKF